MSIGKNITAEAIRKKSYKEAYDNAFKESKTILAPQPESGDSVAKPTPSVLFLIRPDTLTDIDEAMKSAIMCQLAVFTSATQEEDKRKSGWYYNPIVETFQTSKDLKALEKQLKDKAQPASQGSRVSNSAELKSMAVYLYEKEDERKVCKVCGVVRLCHDPTSKIHPFEPMRKPLMLAVFGDTQAIKDVLDASSKAEGEDEIRRLLE